MFAAAVTLLVFWVAYMIGFAAWFTHMHKRFDREIAKPWDIAISNNNLQACNDFHAAAISFLADYDPGSMRDYYPLHWVETWNKQYVPCRGK